MLQTLSIQNVALISNLSVDFGNGFNILLGETGAGKSIIFDSINFVLGAKLDKTLLRYGESTMRVDALFSNINFSTLEKIKEFGFVGEEIVLSRTYSADGKSTCRINGIVCASSVLKEIGQMLVDSYSQHESIDLLKTKNHLAMIDKYGEKTIADIKSKLAEVFGEYKSISKQIEELGGSEFERERTMSLLQYQIEEIENANLTAGEEESLRERLKMLNNAEKIFEAVAGCEELLSESSTSVINSLKNSASFLSTINIDKISDCKERLDSARYEIEDIYETLVDIKNESEFDEKEYAIVDSRLDLIKSLNKKYGGSIEKTLQYLDEIKEKYNSLKDSEIILDKLNKKKDDLYSKILDISNLLSKERKEVSKIVESKVLNELKELGMKSSQFEIKIEKMESPTINGQDNLEFIFSANKGQEVKSLAKTASGGELSRFMLAIKNIFNQIGDAQTLIFDEIDSGISGETGNIVGTKLNNISGNAQVICITHLPQVACYADEFFYVSKIEDENSTITTIENLKGDQIIYNLARMVVGDEVTKTAIDQAKEMRLRTGKTV